MAEGFSSHLTRDVKDPVITGYDCEEAGRVKVTLISNTEINLYLEKELCAPV